MPRSIRTIVDIAAYVGMRLGVGLLQALPLSACERLAEALGWLCGRVLRIRRSTVEENLQIAFPDSSAQERERISAAMWKHLFLMVAEIAQAHRKLHRTNWRERCDIPQVAEIVRTLLAERPKVCISGHYGNFELGGYLLGLFGFPTHTVARTIDNRYIDQYVNQFRGRTGQHMLPKHGSRPEMERILDAHGILTLLGDQAAGEKAVWVDFFGRPASTHKAVALFSLTYEAPMLLVYARREGAALRYHVGLAGVADPHEPPFQGADAPTLIRWFSGLLEGLIRERPDQYWWLHRRWKGSPPARRNKVSASGDAPPQAIGA